MKMSLRCAFCNRPFERPHNRGPIPKYCSESHRQQAYIKRRIDKLVTAALKKGRR